MSYHLSKVFWLLVAPTNALILIGASAALWALFGGSQCAAWLAVVAAFGLLIGAFTPVGLALAVPLENRFPLSRPNSQVAPDGIILLPGGADTGIAAKLGRDYLEARLTFCGLGAGSKSLIEKLGDFGVDPSRINIESQSRTTFEDAFYSAALLKPKASESWLLVTAAMHMPRAIGCFRVTGFPVEAYPVEFTTRGRSNPFSPFATGSSALIQLDRAAKEWLGLIAYRLMGKTDALFPRPSFIASVADLPP
jgi:uncharacterized SAM-binding protein YcdF (DUF218 family)